MSRVFEEDPVEAPRTTVIVPPRPNLGPEPWREDASRGLLPAFIFIIAAGLIAAFILARRSRRATLLDLDSPVAMDDSPEGRLLALCDRLRRSLASRLGPSLRARTTEEVAADPRVADLLGGDDLARLAAILGGGDRIKFARRDADGGLPERVTEWTGWADSLDAHIAARRGAARQSPSP